MNTLKLYVKIFCRMLKNIFLRKGSYIFVPKGSVIQKELKPTSDCMTS